MKKIFYVFLVFSWVFSGCSWIGSKKTSKRVNPDDLVVKLDKKDGFVSDESLMEGNVLDQQKLRKGGKVVVIPFSPGNEIEANDEFDRMTLRMIRGITDEFDQKISKFEIVTSNNTEDAAYIIEGRVTEIQRPSLMKNITFRNNHSRISVQGKLIDRESEKSIVVFSDAVEAQDKKESLEQLGTKIGHHIGHFIVAGGVTK